MSDTTGLPCEVCNGPCIGVPMIYDTVVPEKSIEVPWAEWPERIVNNGSLFMVDYEEYYVKGRLEFPIIGTENIFCMNSWVTLDERNFETIRDTWELRGREDIVGPMVEKMASYAMVDRDTLDLNVIINTAPYPQMPLLELEPSSHRLYLEQRNGITMTRLHQLYVFGVSQVKGNPEDQFR